MAVAGAKVIAAEKAGVPQKAAGSMFLDQLKPMQMWNWPFQDRKGGKPGKGFPPGVDGRVTVSGVHSQHGIFMHPAPMGEPAYIAFALDRKYRTFSGRVTLNDSGEMFVAPLTFSIFADDKLLWLSKPVQSRAMAQDFSVSVKDVTSLRIQVDIQGDAKGAHAVWVEPRLER